MKTSAFFRCLAAIAVTALARGGPGEVEIRPVLPLDAAQRAKLGKLVKDDPEAAGLFAAREKKVRESLSRQPRPLEVIHYEGLVNTDQRRLETVEHLADMDHLAAVFEAWQVRPDPALAAKARGYIVAWAAVYRPTGNDVNENKLLPAFVAWPSLKEGATPEERTMVERWLEGIGSKQVAAVKAPPPELNNRYTKSLRMIFVLGVALDRGDWQQLAVDGLKTFVTRSLRADGTSIDLEQRDTLTYHCSALRPLLDLAVLSPSGAEWYRWESPAGASIKKSVEFVVPYADGTKTRKEWLNTKVELDRKRGREGIEEYRPGRLFEPKSALPLLEQAAPFDPGLKPLVLKLGGTRARRFPSWQSVLHEALRPD